MSRGDPPIVFPEDEEQKLLRDIYLLRSQLLTAQRDTRRAHLDLNARCSLHEESLMELQQAHARQVNREHAGAAEQLEEQKLHYERLAAMELAHFTATLRQELASQHTYFDKVLNRSALHFSSLMMNRDDEIDKGRQRILELEHELAMLRLHKVNLDFAANMNERLQAQHARETYEALALQQAAGRQQAAVRMATTPKHGEPAQGRCPSSWYQQVCVVVKKQVLTLELAMSLYMQLQAPSPPAAFH